MVIITKQSFNKVSTTERPVKTHEYTLQTCQPQVNPKAEDHRFKTRRFDSKPEDFCDA